VGPEEYIGYIIDLSAGSEDFDRHVPTFERVANSFEITGPKAEGTKPTEEPLREISPEPPLFG
jgi:hypothetical protein